MTARPPATPTEQLLRLLFRQAEDYVLFFMSPDGTVIDWSPGAEHVFGFTAEEIIGQSADRLFNEEDVAHRVPEVERTMALAGGRSENERWLCVRMAACSGEAERCIDFVTGTPG